MSFAIRRWAGTLSLAIVAVKRRMPRLRAEWARCAQQRAEAAALPVVGDREGHLGGLGVVVEPHEAADRDQAAHRARRGSPATSAT